jgi:hypothetical protein
MIRAPGVVWFTKFDILKGHEDLILYKNDTPMPPIQEEW